MDTRGQIDPIINTMRQTATPLNVAFFHPSNQQYIHQAIRQNVADQYGVKIDYQNPDDLLVLMRTAYLSNMALPDSGIDKQLDQMNKTVINQATLMCGEGVTSYLGYIRDINSTPVPPEIPVSTSVYGSIPVLNTPQIGM